MLAQQTYSSPLILSTSCSPAATCMFGLDHQSLRVTQQPAGTAVLAQQTSTAACWVMALRGSPSA